jgi:hypothetical protein
MIVVIAHSVGRKWNKKLSTMHMAGLNAGLLERAFWLA